MTTVFADTWYFLALVNPNDVGHARAVSYTQAFRGRMVTTAWVLVEVADALAGTSAGRAEFMALRKDLRDDSSVHIVPFDEPLCDEGVQFYGQHPDKRWSLIDCVSFVVMNRDEFQIALTADHHFEQAGFVAALK